MDLHWKSRRIVSSRLDSSQCVRPMKLVSDDVLKRSAVTANFRMNRERNLVGSNGYDKELRLNPLDLLRERAAVRSSARFNAGWRSRKCMDFDRDA
jgi:hypothetical protein